jgi:hypothetical protein
VRIGWGWWPCWLGAVVMGWSLRVGGLTAAVRRRVVFERVLQVPERRLLLMVLVI